MAIVATGNWGTNVVLPPGYTNPTLPTITTIEAADTYVVDLLATAANVDPAVGAANVLAALKADFEGAQATRLNLNPAGSVVAALTITSYKRMNDGDDVSGFKSGTEQYRCNVSYTYE